MSEPTDLQRLFSDRRPPEGSADRLVEALRAEGLLESRAARWSRRSGLAVAAIVIFFVGYVSRGAPEPVPFDHVLLLWEGPSFEAGAPGEHRQEYARWATSEHAGAVVGGVELAAGTHWVAPPGRASSPESDVAVSGLFMVRGPIETARSLAASHPHVGHGGWVEVRAVR